MTVLYLVRHAHADWTPDENRPLSHRGKLDAERVADVLQRFPIAAIYSSPFRRARETIMPLAARLRLPIHTEPDLRERRLGSGPAGDFEGAVQATWRDFSFAHPGGESNAAAQRRGLAVVHRLQKKHPDACIVLSTHGTLMALLLQHFEPSIDFTFWKSLTMPDIFALCAGTGDAASIRRVWEEAP